MVNYQLEGEYVAKKAISSLNMLFIPSKDNDYSPRFLQSRILLYAVILLLCVKIITVGFFIPFPKNFFFADITKTALLNDLNQTRESAGLQALVENDTLDQAAMLKAQDMVQKEYFAHQSPEGVSPWFWFRQAGYNYHYAGENLAIGFFDSEEVFDAWLNSPGHKANLVNPNYQEVGTAILSGYGGNNTMVVVQLFGSRQVKTAVAQTNPPAEKPSSTPAPVNPSAPVVVQTEPNPAVDTQIKNNNIEEENTPEVVVSNTNPVAPETSENTEEQVLGKSIQITQSTTLLSNANNAYYQLINFIVYDYGKLITYLSYILLIITSGALLLNVLVNFNVQRGQLIFRSMILIAILSLAVFANNDSLLQAIPHQIII